MNIRPETLNVKADGRFNTLQCVRVRVPLTDDHTLQPERLRDIPVCVVFHHDFHRAIHSTVLLLASHNHYATPPGATPKANCCLWQK